MGERDIDGFGPPVRWMESRELRTYRLTGGEELSFERCKNMEVSFYSGGHELRAINAMMSKRRQRRRVTRGFLSSVTF
jgi:hypothetical protein